MKDAVQAILFGKHLATRLIRQNPGKQMLFTLETIGDQCVELAYASEYKKRNHIKHLAIITSKPDHALFRYFSNEYDSLIPVSDNEIHVLLKFYKSDLGQMFRTCHPEIKCAFYTAYTRSDYILENPYVRLCDIEKAILRIPQSTSPCTISAIPCQEWMEDLHQKGLVEKGKTVLINPFANSVKGVPKSFFKELAMDLQERGIKVIINSRTQIGETVRKLDNSEAL